MKPATGMDCEWKEAVGDFLMYLRLEHLNNS